MDIPFPEGEAPLRLSNDIWSRDWSDAVTTIALSNTAETRWRTVAPAVVLTTISLLNANLKKQLIQRWRKWRK